MPIMVYNRETSSQLAKSKAIYEKLYDSLCLHTVHVKIHNR